VARHIRRIVYSPLEPNSHRYASLCRGPVAAAAKVARQLLHCEQHRGARILVDDLNLNKISRRTALALPLGLAASSSTIFNSLANADQPVRGGTMVMIVQPEPSTLAHYAVTAGNIPPIATQIYEGLVTYDWDQNPQPNLATSWETAPDGKSITFKLREGVVFSEIKLADG
jgi:hypothetical protein